MNWNPTDLAYFSGYIDGDGCFSISRHQTGRGTKYSSRLIITAANEENVLWMISHFGGNITRPMLEKTNHKPLYRYTLSGENVEKLNLSDYLIQRLIEHEIFIQFRNEPSKEKKDTLIQKMKKERSANLVQISIKDELESVRKTILPTESDFAYLAGFIDAECSLGIQRSFPKDRPNPTYKIQLQLNDSKIPCFYWISRRFGGQFHFFDRSNSGKLQNQMAWRLSASSLAEILPKILPYLKHKKSVCQALIEFYDTTFCRHGFPSPNSPNYSDFYKPILEKRSQIFDHVTLLNKKGI